MERFSILLFKYILFSTLSNEYCKGMEMYFRFRRYSFRSVTREFCMPIEEHKQMNKVVFYVDSALILIVHSLKLVVLHSLMTVAIIQSIMSTSKAEKEFKTLQRERYTGETASQTPTGARGKNVVHAVIGCHVSESA